MAHERNGPGKTQLRSVNPTARILRRAAGLMAVPTLGIIFALLSAATFALNNAMARRGVVTGTPRQGMAVSIPIGVLCFLPLAIVTGEIFHIAQFPAKAAAWMAGVGLLHFIL